MSWASHKLNAWLKNPNDETLKPQTPDFRSEEAMDVVGKYLELGQAYLTGEEDRKAMVAEAVAAGTMDESALELVSFCASPTICGLCWSVSFCSSGCG